MRTFWIVFAVLTGSVGTLTLAAQPEEPTGAVAPKRMETPRWDASRADELAEREALEDALAEFDALEPPSFDDVWDASIPDAPSQGDSRRDWDTPVPRPQPTPARVNTVAPPAVRLLFKITKDTANGSYGATGHNVTRGRVSVPRNVKQALKATLAARVRSGPMTPSLREALRKIYVTSAASVRRKDARTLYAVMLHDMIKDAEFVSFVPQGAKRGLIVVSSSDAYGGHNTRSLPVVRIGAHWHWEATRD